MKKSLLTLASVSIFGFSAAAADLGLSPSSLKLAVYKVSVSPSTLCTNLTTVVDNGSTPSFVEFANGNVNLGTGSISNGTYPCLVIEMADHIKYTPSANSDSGNCQLNQEETLDVCRSGTSVLSDGTTTTCDTNSNRVAMYLSTYSTGTGDSFNPPTSGDSSNGFPLTASLIVSGAITGKFVVNPAGKVCDQNTAGCDGSAGGVASCAMEPPVFGFSTP